MRILQIIQKPQLRGAEIFACQLSHELVKGNNHVDVVYLFSTTDFALDFDLNFIPLEADAGRRFWDLKAFQKLAAIIARGKYDVVQANAGDTLKYAVFSKLLYGWKSILIFRNANRMSSFVRSVPQRMLNKWLLRQCNFFISVSENARQDLITLNERAASASVTIPIGTYNFDNVLPIPRGTDTTDPVFIVVGSFVPEKNHLFLIEVFRLYVQQNNAGILWLVGDGSLRSQLEEKLKAYRLQSRVHFWGYRNDVSALLKAADIFVMPSLIEGLPAAILEAISCGIPVIASAVGGIPEIIVNNITGICIAEYSPEQYAKSMAFLVNNKEDRDRLVRNAKAKLSEKFTIEKVVAAFQFHYANWTNQKV